MSLARDVQEIMRRVRKAGYVTALSNSGHWLVYDQDRHLLCSSSQTPSDHRAIENLVHQLRRAGVELEGATKYERRESVPYPELSESQRALVANLNAAIAELGYDPNASRSGANSELAKRAIALANGNAPTFDSYTQVVSRLRRGLPISTRSEVLLRRAVEDVLANAIKTEEISRSTVDVLSDSEQAEEPDGKTPAPLSWRVLAAILDPLTTRDEALGLAREVEDLA